MNKTKKRFRISIRRKLAFSYIALVLLIAGISIGFMLTFLDGFILSQQKSEVEKMAAEISRISSIERDKTGDGIFRRFSGYLKESNTNYSFVLLDNDGNYINGINADHLVASDGGVITAVTENLGSGKAVVSEWNKHRFVLCSSTVFNGGDDGGYVVVSSFVAKIGIGNDFFSFYLISILFASVFALLLAEILSDKMTSDIKRLKYRAELLAARKFDVDVPIRSKDEVGELADSIDLMAESIKEYDNNQKVFLQNASHELRTPLMSIRGYVEGIKDGVFTDTDYAYDMILSQTERLEKLVNEVMYLSKIETADGMIKLEQTPLSDIIEETRDRVKGIFDNSEIRLNIDAVPDIMLNADCDNLSTAFTNIITNCIRYARTEIRIEFILSEKLSVRISDDGNGINESDLPSVFKRFYKGKKGKYGLGLAIAKAVAEAHHGSITAFNKQMRPDVFNGDCGAVFEIVLPYIPTYKTLNGKKDK